MFVNTPCSNTRALPSHQLSKGSKWDLRDCLWKREWSEHSVAYSSVTILLNGEQVSHKMHQPSMLLKKIIFLQIVLLSRHCEKILHLLHVYSGPQPQLSRLAQAVKTSSYRNDKQFRFISEYSQVIRIYNNKLYFTRLYNASFSYIPRAFSWYIIPLYRYLLWNGLPILVIVFKFLLCFQLNLEENQLER